MEDCCDPLLATDASPRPESFSRSAEKDIASRSRTVAMADLDSNCELSNDVDMEQSSPDLMKLEQSSDPVALDGKVVLGFSLASPDLVNCGASPDLPRGSYEDSPEFSKKRRFSTELSLENGIDGSTTTTRLGRKSQVVKFSAICQTFGYELSPESSFELPSPPGDFRESMTPVISINSGSISTDVTVEDVTFLKDEFFSGGESITTDAVVGNEDEILLYQTARLGNFAYKFQSLDPGDYFIDLHFAEIEFTKGPPGVISGLDLFSQVGANTPLVIEDLRMLVGREGELSIRLEGVTGAAILCGISIRKETTATYVEETGMLAVKGSTDTVLSQQTQENLVCRAEEEAEGMRSDCEQQRKEMEDMKRMVEELKLENQQKTRECEEALNSLSEIQNELMRKSMHVGSLAFAVEGQVKEKSRWFSSLRDLTRKLKIMKVEQIKLLEEATTYKHLVQDINEFSSHIQSRVKQDAELHENLKVKFVAGEKERKELYNKILELKGNIRVFCRCRPLNFEETEAGVSMGIDVESTKNGEVIVMSNGFPKKSFKFDSVFGPNASQADVFEDTAPFATSVIDGYNVCIFAYGQTGTGKTFTMEGTQHDRGVNYRTLENLFRIIKAREHRYNYEISVSVLEVYNEQIRDLLVPASQSASAPKRFEIRQLSEGNHHVPGLVEAPVKSIEEVWDVLKTGSNARAVGKTTANEHSSRSHCIHCVMVKGENLLNGECTKSKLWLVDLAGSERVAKTEVQGERLKETQNINKSLSALGDVIFALANKSSHIPFRNSKLTHLLQDSLGGDSKTLMFVQISPNENDQSETLCSLNFASRVRGIELGPAKKQLDNTELLKYKQMVEKWKQDMKGKDEQIRKMEETMYGLEAKIKERDTKNKTLQDKVKELESQLLVERKLARQHVDTKIAEQQTKQQTEDENNTSKRPPLTNILLGSASKEMVNLTRPSLLESTTSYDLAPLPSGVPKYNDLSEKENNPEMADQVHLPNKTGRFSICAKRIPSAPAPRRSSLAPTTSTSREMVYLTRPPLSESTTSYDLPPLPNGGLKYSDLIEKVNNQEMAEQVQIPKRIGAGRSSICAKRIPPAPRRKSFAPMPFIPITSTLTSPDEKSGANQVLCTSPKLHRSNGKTLTSILRRSIQKRMQMKPSPRQQPMRRGGGINVGMERVRLSIGNRGRLAHRVLLTNARKAGLKETPQKQERWI
ncbi:Di-glucose binding protein with Kinesin motor domain-containing protein [Arabidopsis thaliana]|uniref:Di-glucose binding protein with Kinesin motor domain-containing protein n=1 Tax=Arabidopsis thaliana TaxID=3702 RepID=A0A2H1ZEF8_ARATH|nr:Di-glucose binding protein with Kinesin motor domain-containing protein [Arabidopsis thaliana]AEE35294.2 Di-glucose binding protein with Kinesin motor domain-containing protein [Arabidopsis thaliana]|eukprot:NP_001319365.1 Di-glucose binding protein with Kinesin motor domain-containing protein [Arabidopsis thaliana]